MNNNGRNNYSRRRYSDRQYKKLIIEDKENLEQAKVQKESRIETARDRIVNESGYTEGIKQYIKSKHGKARRAKTSKLRTFGKKATAVGSVAMVIVILGLIIFPPNAKAEMVTGYEIKMNGTILGVAESVEPIAKALDDIRTEFSEEYGMTVFDATVLEYNQVVIDKQFICPEQEFIKILKNSVDVKVEAWVILVNSAPAAAVKTEEEAQAALARVLQPFLDVPTTRNRVEVDFVENVDVKRMPIEYSQITDEETAYKLLRFGGDFEEKYHVVVSGESLYSISNSYGVKTSDLRKANPTLASTDKIYPGDRLLITIPLNRVNVKFVEELDKVNEPIPYETDVIEDDTMLVTEKVVVQAGINGSHDVHALITYINGVETDMEIISEENRIEPLNQIVRKGTKPVPKIQQLASEGGMPMPLKSGSYYISSKFGPRNIDVPGASTWHKGVDLAANKGTPIYASMAGTVTHSGSGTGYGLYIKIDHGDGVETRYGHCSELLVTKGEHVEQGQLIALVGNTGISGGSHLHFEVRLNGVARDPLGEYEGTAP
ncbi:MAG: M23 family metallopeptidase [Clostridia bacterium]|nr:M23 family metallopeptidase [Clostridia bacterium]